MKKDAYLLAWLRSKIIEPSNLNTPKYLKSYFVIIEHDFDVKTTATKLRAALEWRKEVKADNLLSEDFSIFKKNYPFDIEGVDLQGRPIWVSQIGKWDLRKIQLSGLTDKYNRYRLYLNELVAKRIRDLNEAHPDNTE